MVFIVLGGCFLLCLSGLVVLYFYKKTKAYKKQVERSLKIVPLKITVPRDLGSKNMQGQTRDDREAAKEIVSFMETFYANLSTIYKRGFKNIHRNFFYGQRHLSLEIIAKDREIFFYMGVPVILVDMVEKMLSSQYPEALIEESEELNIFSEEWKEVGVCGGELKLLKKFIYPIKTYKNIDSEPLESITNALSRMSQGEGAAIQMLIRPVSARKMGGGRSAVRKSQNQKNRGSIAGQIIDATLTNGQGSQSQEPVKLTAMEEEVNKAIEEKAGKPAFETIIRFVVSTQTPHRSEMILAELQSAFAQFNDQNLNGFKFVREKNVDKLVTDYIFRFFEHKLFSLNSVLGNFLGHKSILNTEELSSIFHLPNYLTPSPGINWLPAKMVELPLNIPQEGTVIGKATYRGEEKVIRVSDVDKRRHVYILGQTGTGKSNLMKNMIVDDIMRGKGVAYIDPHGQDLEDVISKIPKERAEDVIIFDAGDIERPMGLNIFEAETTEQKDLVTNEALDILYSLYDPNHSGQIFGPRFDHWFRNAALTLMADPAGGTFIEIPTLFTNERFLAEKLKHVEDPIVRSFWVDEFANTSQQVKSEMLSYFIPKFGAFMTNTTMRNIMGQPISSLKLREIMDNKKILLVNLSKGRIGEKNMKLLGMIFVIKLQVAAMSRADVPEDQRQDFTLYVDEFQNFLTESFAQILSEARKYRFILVVANQFVGQLTDEIRTAVFGNVGTVMSFRVGPEDGEYMVKQFEPVFNVNDMLNMENGYAVIRLMINGYPSRPFIVNPTWPPIGVSNPKVGEAIKQLSRLKYAKPKEIVDQEVLSRMPIQSAGSQEASSGDLPRS
ncbi:MAG: DUF87 domain-containing protein [bacterium]|nr:DUF87 domain-containing protein [bacterium]